MHTTVQTLRGGGEGGGDFNMFKTLILWINMLY